MCMGVTVMSVMVAVFLLHLRYMKVLTLVCGCM